MKTINVRVSDELVQEIEKQLKIQKDKFPGMKIAKSDIIRNILETHFSKKGAK